MNVGVAAFLALMILFSGVLPSSFDLAMQDRSTPLEPIDRSDHTTTLSEPPSPASPSEGPVVVVAIIDTGINPYHEAYRDDSPLGQMYPGEYIPGFPDDVPALELTLDADTLEEALAADCESVWATIEKGRLYWIPGTRIVGALHNPYNTSVLPASIDGDPNDVVVDCDASPPRIPPIFSRGHGHMASSKIVGEGFGLCQDLHCRLVSIDWVSVGGIEFVGNNTHWIDIQVQQRYIPVTSATPISDTINENHGTEIALTPRLARAIEESASKHLTFWSAGNGYPLSTQMDGRLTPSVVIVGGHDNGYPMRPLVASHFIGPGSASTPAHISGDICFNWAATRGLAGYEKTGGGTSSAAPYAAGGAAKILLEARRTLGHEGTGIIDGIAAQGSPSEGSLGGPLADGILSLDEWKTLLLRTATARPEYQFADGDRCSFPDAILYDAGGGPSWSEIPDTYPSYMDIGYGAVDERSVMLAMDVLGGSADLPERPAEYAFFEMDRTLREIQFAINTGH